MSVRVKLPPILQEFSGGIETLEVSGRTVSECLEKLEAQFPGMRESLLDRQGKLLRVFGIYLNADGLHPVEMDTQLQDGDEIVILNFLMGG
jgi:molybdopterin synthase sulfur carrier subunit